MQRLFRVCVLMAVLVPLVVLAANKNEKDKKSKTFTKVSSVSASDNAITIADGDGNPKTYTVDSFTTITINGKPGKLTDVQSGMKADIAASGAKISRLDVMDPPQEKGDKKKKK